MMEFLEPSENGSNPAPKIQYNWVDITIGFKDAVQDLELGELLHDSLFGLFEAMSAIEMMDPKMDAGMMCNRGNKRARTFDQAVKDGVLKLNDISDPDLIGIMDTTLACVVSWLEGHSLAQTVFTNLYLHRPYAIEDRRLKVFCVAIYKLIEIIKEYIHSAMVYEEEDFQTMQYGYHLCPDVSEQRILGMLHEVEDELHRGARHKVSESVGSPINEALGVYCRIRFIRVLYHTLILFIQRREESITAENQRLIKNKLKTLAELLVALNETVDLAETGPVMGFEPLINQRLLPPTFPRYTKIKPRCEALAYFESMIERFHILSSVYAITTLNTALDFFVNFSKKNPCLLSRSALQLLYVGSHSMIHNTNPTIFKEILREAAKSFISPPALVSKPIMNNPQVKGYVDQFFTHCTRPFANLLQLCGHNRARQRDKLAHILEEFTSLQDEAERVDAYLHTISMSGSVSRPHLACFGTWILYHSLRIMIMFLLSGFELELYSFHEYHYIYWYLYEFLYGWLVSALTRADSFLTEQEILLDMQKSKGVKKKNKFKKKPRPFYRESVYYQALQNMCGGYYKKTKSELLNTVSILLKALMGFRMDGKLQMPHPQFDSEQVRYDHRFAPFQNLLTPPPVHYPEFRELTSPSRYQQQPVDSMYLYFAGCKHFHQSRQMLESIVPTDGEINELLKISKTNFVVLKLLAGGHKKESNKPPEFDFSLNKHFPIIKLV